MSDMTPSDRELVDEYASRLLDADVSRHEIPSHLVGSVEARLVEFARLRDTLRNDRVEGWVDQSADDSRSNERTSDAVSVALASMTNPPRSTSNVVRLRRRQVFSVLAAAAAVVTLVAIGLSDRASAPDDMATDAPVSSDTGTEAPTADFKMESASEATVSGADGGATAATEAPAAVTFAEAVADSSAGSSNGSSNGPSTGASAPDVELSSVDDLQVFLESEIVANGRLLDGVVTRVPPLCPDPDGRPAIERGVWVEGRPAELHWSALDGAVVYLVDDCSAIMYITP